LQFHCGGEYEEAFEALATNRRRQVELAPGSSLVVGDSVGIFFQFNCSWFKCKAHRCSEICRVWAFYGFRPRVEKTWLLVGGFSENRKMCIVVAC